MRAMRRSLVLVLVAVGFAPPPAPVAPRPVVAATPAPIAAPATGAVPAVPALRLPRTFLPTSYAARLEIDPAKDGFEGAIAITGVIDHPSSVLWLHGRDLVIHRASATREREEVALTVTPYGEDLLELRAVGPLGAGEWTLLVDYGGKLDRVNTTGAFEQVVAGDAYVFTQLEALDARRVFPCFDEPDNKVPWKLTLDVPQKLVAVSNTSIATEVPLAGDRKRVEFAATKPLPSYLIAFGVGPFELVDGGKTRSGTPVRIVTLAHRAADAAYAAKTTAKLLELTEELCGIPYPYDKLDILSIPLTVGFSAMENAGLITFTESLVLLDKPSRQREHEWIAVAAHEIAHQWFGGLVTMGYWDDIWLHEGFATWLAHKTAARFDPSWHDEQSGLGVRDDALEADGLVSARQLRQPIHVQDDILDVFDGITYDKGASVLDMFEAYLGPEVFQRGVRDYLKARAWGNATSADFIGALGTAAGKDVGAAFSTFLDQPGAPEITATVTCTGTGTASVSLAQHRYLPPGARTPAATTPWIVPVCVAFERGGKRAETCTQLDQPTATIALDVPRGACPRWLMPNVNGRGYYRTTYTAAQAATLRDEAWPQLSWSERRAVYFDVADGVMTGRLPLMLALSFVPRLLAGNDRFTVEDALELPTSLGDLVSDELRGKYTAWIRETFGPGARQAGFTSKTTDDLDVEATRRALLGAVAWTGRDPELVATAVSLADNWRELPQAMRELVLSIAVDAKPEVFERIRKDVVTEPDRARRLEMFSALGSVRDVKQQTLALGLMLDGRVDMREALTMLSQGSTDALRVNAQQFFRDHADEIVRRMPRDEVAGLSGVFTETCKAERRDEIIAYVTRMFGKLPGGAHQVKERIEAMDQCIARRKILEPEVRGWLTGVKIAKPAAPKPETKVKAATPGKHKDRKAIEGAEKAPARKHRRK